MPRVTDRLYLPDHELEFRASRSGGPGGQHANNTASKVEAVWDVRESTALTDWQRRRILKKLDSRLTNDGVLIVSAQDERSQHRNKELATERLVSMVKDALYVPPPRRKTKPSRNAKRKRMDRKTRRGKKKKLRGRVRDW